MKSGLKRAKRGCMSVNRRTDNNTKRLENKQASGYILLEALLAILLLSVGMLAVVQAYNRAMHAVQLQQHYLAPAKALAEALLTKQELQALTGLPVDDFAKEGRNGRFRYRIDYEDWQVAPNLQQVIVTVSWDDRGRPGNLAISALLPARQ